MKSAYQKTKEFRERHPEQVRAYRIVFVAVRNGSLKRKSCVECGKKKTEAHHRDYTKPLDVMWLCKQHHIEYDRKRRKLIHR